MIDNIVRTVIAIVADPGGQAPTEAIGNDVRVAGLGLFYQEKLIPPSAAQVIAGVAMRRLSAVSGLGIPTNLPGFGVLCVGGAGE